MALFRGNSGPLPDTKDQYNRTNTKLQHSEHDKPAESFMIDPRLKRLFRYHFGGDGWVVIPKGRAVAPATNGGDGDSGRFHNFDRDTYMNALTLANGGKDVTELNREGQEYTRTANKAIGVAYANLFEEFVDGFNRMQPTVENEIYIELPYIANKEQAEEMEWGSFYDKDMARPVKAGDFVMPDENGRLIKADFDLVKDQMNAAATSGDLAAYNTAAQELALMQEQVIGQVWAIDANLPPHGWLKWVGWNDEDMANDEWRNRTGHSASDIGAEGDFPGYPYEKTYRNFDVRTNKYYPQGVPGLTNGSRIRVPFEDVEIGQVNAGQEGRYDLRIAHTPLVEGTVKISIDGVEQDGSVVQHIDYPSGLVVLNVPKNETNEPKLITATYEATGQLPGVPTGWDFEGSLGGIRILLQK